MNGDESKGAVMSYEITTVDLWFGEVEDRPGALAEKLETLMRAGANLEFAIMRPASDVLAGTSLLFVAPLIGEAQTQAAREAGLDRSGSLHALRIIGPDQPGQVAGMARTLADAGIRVSGLWAAAIGDRSVQYLRLESGADAKRAAQLLAPRLA